MNMILTIYVTLCYNHPAEYPAFPLFFSLPPYLINDFSSLFCLKCTLYSVHQSIYFLFLLAYNGPTDQNNQLWSKLHSKLWFVICIISCFVYKNMKYEIWKLGLWSISVQPVIFRATSLRVRSSEPAILINWSKLFKISSCWRSSIIISSFKLE